MAEGPDGSGDEAQQSAIPSLGPGDRGQISPQQVAAIRHVTVRLASSREPNGSATITARARMRSFRATAIELGHIAHHRISHRCNEVLPDAGQAHQHITSLRLAPPERGKIPAEPVPIQAASARH